MSKRWRVEPGARVSIGDFDPGDTSGVRGGKKKGEELQAERRKPLEDLQELLWADHSHRLLIVLQGMDTSGKDGAIRSLMDAFDAAGVRVVSFKKPTPPELEHDFLWRVHAHVPGDGEVVIFNRSHYEDVLVARVRSLVPKNVWRDRYRQINDFERLLAESGTTILKFFLHISRDEQRERLQARVDEPEKRWKFNHGDLEERKLWDDYMTAYEDMLAKTSTKYAPWYVVPADKKWYRNHVIGSVVLETLQSLEMSYPEVDLGEIVIE